MAVIRDLNNYDNTASQIATLALFCGISCTILMLKLGGFKASLNFSSGKKNSKDHVSNTQISISGAYRTNRNEFYAHDRISAPPKKITPSMVQLPASAQIKPSIRPYKSTGDLTNNDTDLKRSIPEVSQNPKGVTTENRNSTEVSKKVKSKETNIQNDQKKIKQTQEQKKTDKIAAQERAKQEKIAAQERAKREKLEAQERAKREKLEAQERAKQQKAAAQMQAKEEKLRKDREKKEAQQQAKGAKKKNSKEKVSKKKAIVPDAPRANPLAQVSEQYSTNTLESSTSKTSGPPPYTETVQQEITPSMVDQTGNVSFGKSMDTGSWDMISQHRQQLSRPTNKGGGKPKQKMMDLQYKVGGNLNYNNEDNSEA